MEGSGAGSESETRRVPLGHCLVTGAAGFLGRNLVRALLERGEQVRALVHRRPLELTHPRLECLAGDVGEARDLQRACVDVETVFHAAARISLMGGRWAGRRYREETRRVNLGGTRKLLCACREQGVRRLVHTSTVDVCFDGSPLPGMTEDVRYAARPRSVYAETKIAAESLVLEADGREGLLTCAVRPDGIWGAGDCVLLERFLEQLAAGRLVAAIGDPGALQDNSHVANLVHGEILAAEHLFPGSPACGRAYFIGDGEPANAFEFFRPLIEGLGHRFPSRRVPAGLLRPLTALWQALHFCVGIPPPLLTPHELDKVTVTHYASLEAARRDLGYAPVTSVARGMEECLLYCRDRLSPPSPVRASPWTEGRGNP